MPLIGAQGPGSQIAWRGNLDEYPDSFGFVEVVEVFPGTAATCSPEIITGINYKALVTAVGSACSVRITPYQEETDNYGTAGPFLPGNDIENNPIIIRNKDKIELQIETEAAAVAGRGAFNRTYSTTVNIGKRGPVEWFIRTRELDDDPDPFDFTDLTNLEINTLTVSDTVTVTGIDDTIGVDIFIVGTGELRINGTGSFSQTAKIFDGDTLQLRNTTSNFYNQSVETIVQIGVFQANFVITTRLADTTINDFTFNDITDVDINTEHNSNVITISGADDNLNGNNPLPLSFSGNGQYRIRNSDNVVIQEFTNSSTNTCSNGDKIDIKQTSSSNYDTTTNANLTVSNQSDTFSVTTRPRPIDTIPDSFNFIDQGNGVDTVPRNTLITSNTITLAGMTGEGDEGTASISTSGGGTGQFKVVRDGSTVRDWGTASFGVRLGDQITLRVTSATASASTRSVTFTVSGTNTFNVIEGVNGSTSDTWRVTSKQRECALATTSTLFDGIRNYTTSDNLTPGSVAKTTFTVQGDFEFDCNVTASTTNSTSYLKNLRNNSQGSSLSDVKQGDVIEVYMTVPYFCQTSTTTISLSAAFSTPGSSRSTTWSVSPGDPPRPSLSLSASPINPAFVFPDGGSSTIEYEYTHVTNSSVTTNFGVSSIPVTTLGDQTKTGSKGVSSLPSGTNTFNMTVSNCTGSTSDSVNVIVGTPPAPTLFFCVNQTATSSCPSFINVSRGTAVTFRWSSQNAVRVEAIQGTGFSTGNRQSGSDTATPSSDGEIYTARAIGAGSNPETVDKSIEIRYAPGVNLSVSPSSVITGNSVTITWSSTDADFVQSSSGLSFNNISSLSGSKTVTMSNDGTYTWSITVKDNGTGLSATASDSVSVSDDTTVDSFTMNPSSRTGVNLGADTESEPRFNSSPATSVHGLSPGVSVTARLNGGSATFLDGTTSKTVSNGTSTSNLRVKMKASNSFDTKKTTTLSMGGNSASYEVTTKSCVVENGTYNIDGVTLSTRRLLASGNTNIMGIIGGSGSGTTGGNREKVSTGTQRYGRGSHSLTLPAGTSSLEVFAIGAGGGGGKGDTGNDRGGGGGGGGGASYKNYNKAEGGDRINIRVGDGGEGKVYNEGRGDDGGDTYVEISGARVNERLTAGGGEGGGGGRNSSPGGVGGSTQGTNGAKGRDGGSRRSGREGGHGGGAGRTTGGKCDSGVAAPNSKNCDQGGPGQGSTTAGNCGGDNRQRRGTEEGANGHAYGGGGSGGGCGNGGGAGSDGRAKLIWTISYKSFTKLDVLRRINKAYWDDINRAATGSEMKTWYNRFKDDPGNYPDLDSLYNTIRSSISGSVSNVSDNCGNSYPKWT